MRPGHLDRYAKSHKLARRSFAPHICATPLGTKQDAADRLQLLQDASAEMKVMAQAGKCWDTAEKEFKLAKYESWPGYAAGLPFIARRYCGLWGRGT